MDRISPKLSSEQRALVESGAQLATRLARRARWRWPELSPDELLSIANEAVVLAARAFDPSRGVPFEAYAYRRVRGHLLRVGGAEAIGRSPPLRALLRVDDDATSQKSEPANLSEALSDTPPQARQRAVRYARREIAALIAAALLAPTPRQADEQIIVRDSTQRALAALESAVSRLPEPQRRFVDLYYRSGTKLEEIAAEFGRSIRTVQRLHDAIKSTLAIELTRSGITEMPPVGELSLGG